MSLSLASDGMADSWVQPRSSHTAERSSSSKDDRIDRCPPTSGPRSLPSWPSTGRASLQASEVNVVARSARRVVAIMATLSAVLIACGETDASDPPERGSSAEPSALVSRASADQVDASIVRIVGFGCGAPTLGTGFAVDTDLVITNGHIITGRDPETLAVQRSDGSEYPNLVTDVPIVDGVAIGIRTEDQQNIVNEIDFSVDAPVVVNWDGVFRDTDSTYRGIRIDAEIRKGDSGSPLLINNRDVIGLIQSKTRDQPRGYAVRSIEIVEFVDSIDPSVQVVADRCA